jgi:hypothetical protein
MMTLIELVETISHQILTKNNLLYILNFLNTPISDELTIKKIIHIIIHLLYDKYPNQ